MKLVHEQDRKKDEDKGIPKGKAPLLEEIGGTGGFSRKGFVLAAAAAAIIAGKSGCTYEIGGVPVPEEEDGGNDAGGADADVDGGEVTDGGHDEDAGMDGGPDADVDGGETDGGVTDGGETDGGVEDGGTDGGADAGGPLCAGVYNEVVVNGPFDRNVDTEVGGYYFRYLSYTTTTVTMDIRCGSDSSLVEAAHVFTVGVEGTINVPADSKRIRVTVNSKNTFTANCDVTVENL
ncbi:MAG: hypothetical protein AB1529_02285 [Candidatus Micrarchaeota archaeon]